MHVIYLASSNDVSESDKETFQVGFGYKSIRNKPQVIYSFILASKYFKASF